MFQKIKGGSMVLKKNLIMAILILLAVYVRTVRYAQT